LASRVSLLYVSTPLAGYLAIFFSNAPAPPDIYTLSLHDALPILRSSRRIASRQRSTSSVARSTQRTRPASSTSCCTSSRYTRMEDRKSTRLNSSHVKISYAVFCLKKKKKESGNRKGETGCATNGA